MAKKTLTPEQRITELFFKTAGVHLGLYNQSSGQLKEGYSEEGLYVANLQIAKDLLEKGNSEADIRRYLVASEGAKATYISEVMPTKSAEAAIKATDNLLNDETAYVHPELYDRVASSYAVQGGIMVPVARGAVYRKQTYTLRNATEYYFRKAKVANTPRTWDSAMGAIRWLLNHARVDEVLTAIDIAVRENESVSAIGLNNFLDDAKEEVELLESRSRE